jgi:hypothetical protein
MQACIRYFEATSSAEKNLSFKRLPIDAWLPMQQFYLFEKRQLNKNLTLAIC